MRSCKSVAAKVLAKWWKTCLCLSLRRNGNDLCSKGSLHPCSGMNPSTEVLKRTLDHLYFTKDLLDHSLTDISNNPDLSDTSLLDLFNGSL